ncbi:MAG: aspartate/glutamate racemase family protein [Chloroflexi bacterium]|nr:aspartate/glutamate racemase family protein [Chloroflexota bacterium]
MMSRRSFLWAPSVGTAALWRRTAQANRAGANSSTGVALSPNVETGASQQIKLLYIGGGKSPQHCAEPFSIVETTGFDAGTIGGFESHFYQHLAARQVIRKAVEAEKKGYDAVVIGCFDDPGLWEARELVRIPVVGVGEACYHLASMLTAGRFSVLMALSRHEPRMAMMAHHYGVISRIASWRGLNVHFREMGDNAKTETAVLREARGAVEDDGAEVIVLGCTGLSVLAQRAQQQLGVPVLDPILVGLKVAELRATLWRRFEISHSKSGSYAQPGPADEFEITFKKAYRTP